MKLQLAGPDPPLARPGHFSSLVTDLSAHRVTCKGRKLHLSPTEFRLLWALMERTAHVYSRETLLNRVWGRDSDLEIRAVDAQIRRLRKALGVDEAAKAIRTVRGAGYALDTAPD